MSYYRGDYYRGDPFSIGGVIGGIGKVLSGVVGGMITGGPAGAIAGGVRSVMPGGAGLVAQGPGKPVPGIVGAMQRFVPGGATGYIRSKRMNVTNPRALRRAIRRVSGFGKLVQRSKRAIAKANTAVGNKQRAAGKRRFGK
jgi:hypothetical protein